MSAAGQEPVAPHHTTPHHHSTSRHDTPSQLSALSSSLHGVPSPFWPHPSFHLAQTIPHRPCPLIHACLPACHAALGSAPAVGRAYHLTAPALRSEHVVDQTITPVQSSCLASLWFFLRPCVPPPVIPTPGTTNTTRTRWWEEKRKKRVCYPGARHVSRTPSRVSSSLCKSCHFVDRAPPPFTLAQPCRACLLPEQGLRCPSDM